MLIIIVPQGPSILSSEMDRLLWVDYYVSHIYDVPKTNFCVAFYGYHKGILI